MGRKCFFSFHYKPDNWRASQVRNMGVVEGNASVSDNDWESITRGGDAAIKRWIDEQLNGRSCTVVLVGENTAGRKWIDYEIERSWNEGKGLVGIAIHRLKDRDQMQSNAGRNPFEGFTLKNGKRLADLVKVYSPPFFNSQDVYGHIKTNIDAWVEEAIRIRLAA